MGDPSTGTGRVNLGGGINSFGTTIGPIVVAIALFGSTAAITDEKIAALSLSKVIILYTCVGALFLGAAALFYFSKKVPDGISLEKVESGTKALYTLLIMTGLLVMMFVPVFSSYKTDLTNASDAEKHALEAYRLKWLLGALAIVVVGLLVANMNARKNATGWGAMKYPQLVLGMLAIFVYVGVEVSIGSNLLAWLRELETLLDKPVSLALVSADLDPVLGFEVVRNGRLIYELQPELWFKHRSQLWFPYTDSLPFRQAAQKQLLQFAEEVRRGS